MQAGGPLVPQGLWDTWMTRDRGPRIQSLTYFLWAPPSFCFRVEAFSPQAGSPFCLCCSGRLSLPPNTFIFFLFQAWGLGRGLADCGYLKAGWNTRKDDVSERQNRLGLLGRRLCAVAGPETGWDTAQPDAHSAWGSFWPLSSGEGPGERAAVSPVSPSRRQWRLRRGEIKH